MNPSATKSVLDVQDLTTSFRLRSGRYPAIRNVSFALSENETLALVGESGCGKTITALSVMRLIPDPPGRITSGKVLFKETDLLGLSEEKMRAVRGNQLAMIFQEPMTSLNPVLTVGLQISESLLYHQPLSRKEAREKALAIMEQVKIPSAVNRFHDYPHQFSGGMRQRVMIAVALACQPDILIADEPTTALDVTIQAQILSLLADLKKDRKMSMLFITHNLGIVAAIADRVAIMYGGEIVEMTGVEELFHGPLHPYTEALLKSVPRIDRTIQKLSYIPGQVPALDRMPRGCHFAPRCPIKMGRCEEADPDLVPVAEGPGHHVRCWVRNKN